MQQTNREKSLSSSNGFRSPEGVSLREYVDDKLENLEKAIDARFESVTQTTNSALASADKANLKAENAIEKRFEGVNEFRAALSDQTHNFLTRKEFDAKWENVEKNRKDNTTLFMAMVGIVISIVSLITRFI